jgi:hypothetical protein
MTDAMTSLPFLLGHSLYLPINGTKKLSLSSWLIA